MIDLKKMIPMLLLPDGIKQLQLFFVASLELYLIWNKKQLVEICFWVEIYH